MAENFLTAEAAPNKSPPPMKSAAGAKGSGKAVMIGRMIAKNG